MAPIPNPQGPEDGAPAPGRVSGRYAPAPVQVIAMRPIANPEDMSPAERARVYGDHPRGAEGYGLPRPAGPYSAPVRHQGGRPVHTEPRRTRPTAAPPVAAARLAPRPAPHAIAHPAAPVAAPAASTAKPPAAPKPAAGTHAPVASPAAAPTPLIAQGKLGRLQTAVGGAVARGATLMVSPDVAQGLPGPVTLSLPATLLSTLRTESAKLGLARAVARPSIAAVLVGQGYAITPNGRQTAALKPGEAARFTWQVVPAQGVRGPLRADIDTALTGLHGKPQALALGAIQSAAPPAPAPAKASGFRFPHLPGFGRADSGDAAGIPPGPTADGTAPTGVSDRTKLAAVLAAIGVVLLVMVSGNARRQRRLAEHKRRQKAARPLAMDETPPAP